MNGMNAVQHLAWHETLEIHELVALQAMCLMKLKKSIHQVADPDLRNLYAQSIRVLDGNLRELLAFYPQAPIPPAARKENNPEMGFYAGELLGSAKTLVRNYAIAITETATPALREVLTNQLNAAIQLHASVFYFMEQRSYYPAYNLQRLLANDVQIAQRALSM
jgi:spore coat protein F